MRDSNSILDRFAREKDYEAIEKHIADRKEEERRRDKDYGNGPKKIRQAEKLLRCMYNFPELSYGYHSGYIYVEGPQGTLFLISADDNRWTTWRVGGKRYWYSNLDDLFLEYVLK